MVAGEFRKQVHGLFLHLMHNIDHRAIAVTHNGNDAVCEFNRLWFTGQQTRTFAQPLNGNHFNARFLQTFCQFRTCRVNCDTVVCDQNIDTGARVMQVSTLSTRVGIRPRTSGATMMESAEAIAVSQ